MFSGLGSGLKRVALALVVGRHGVPRQRKKHCREGSYHVLSSVNLKKLYLNI